MGLSIMNKISIDAEICKTLFPDNAEPATMQAEYVKFVNCVMPKNFVLLKCWEFCDKRAFYEKL
jgi:hypothetical protein